MTVKQFTNKKGFSCNVYVCCGEKGNFVIDPGFYDSELDEYLSSIGKIDFILLTHGHFDHILGLDDLCKKYPEAKVYCFESEIPLIFNSEFNASSYMYRPFVPDVEIEGLSDGNKKIGNYEFFVIHTPGHTAGSCVFYFPEEKLIFTGDTLIESSIGRTDLPTGSDEQMFSSLEKLKKYDFDKDSEVYFGHGLKFSMQELYKYNPYMKK